MSGDEYHRTLGLQFGLFTIWTMILASNPVELFVEMPDVLFTPPLLLEMLPTDLLRDKFFVAMFRWLLLVSCIALAFNFVPFRGFALLSALGLLLFDAYMKSYGGFINHAQMGPLYCAMLYGIFFPSGTEVNRSKHSVSFLKFSFGLLLLAYSFIGLRRFVWGGYEIFTGDSILVHFIQKSLMYGPWPEVAFGGLLVGLPGLPLIAKFGYFFTTLFEVLSPFCLVSVRFAWIWLGVMLNFHVLTLFTMQIFFWENVILLVLMITPLSTWIGRVISHHKQYLASHPI
ncbi:MAG: hypothetical protein EA369_07060 [Bradymonadales bacterium]|nr:MAG: hypothetical protein EA369_07060 [Bradymonadales bacterium]